MIILSNMSNPNLGYSGCADEIWAIVRSDKRIPSYMIHMPELAPSWELFKKYLTWRDTGHWNRETFEQKYVPQYLRELRYSNDAIDALCHLKGLDQSDKVICLTCFCQDETMCHRSILAGVLQGMGYNVRCDDYSRYYNMMLHIDNPNVAQPTEHFK